MSISSLSSLAVARQLRPPTKADAGAKPSDEGGQQPASQLDLFQAHSIDPISILSVICLLVAVATVACLAPARRAARVDPMEALRYE